MKIQTLVTGFRNLTLLVLIVMPIFFLLVWLQALALGSAGATDLSYILETGGVYYLNNVLPILAGGLLHQVAWFALPQDWSVTRRRGAALILAVIIPLSVVVVWGGQARRLLWFIVPVTLSLVLYVHLMRSNADRSTESI